MNTSLWSIGNSILSVRINPLETVFSKWATLNLFSPLGRKLRVKRWIYKINYKFLSGKTRILEFLQFDPYHLQEGVTEEEISSFSTMYHKDKKVIISPCLDPNSVSPLSILLTSYLSISLVHYWAPWLILTGKLFY